MPGILPYIFQHVPCRLPHMRRLQILILTIFLAACSSTSVVTQWHDPATTQLHFSKVLALCITKDPSLRRAAEGELCRQISSVPCKPASFAIPDAMMDKSDEAKALVTRAGFDGAVVVRVVDAREKVTYVPPTYGPTFWGYYRYARPVAGQPGHYRKDQILRLETSIYSITQDQLVWVGTTETMNPTSLPDTVEAVVTAIRKELEQDKLIPTR
jgi:hypothetical protein